jgi:hypothetical protein
MAIQRALSQLATSRRFLVMFDATLKSKPSVRIDHA